MRHRPPLAARLSCLLACAAVLSCTVGFWDYQRIEAPEAQYVNVGCGNSGPPRLAYYPFQGIYIGVALSPLQLDLHVPRGTTVTVDGDITVSGTAAAGDSTLTLHLKLARQEAPPEGLLVYGYDERHDSSWHSGVPTSDALIDRMTRGTLHLPAITINGRTWPPQDLPFERRSYQRVMGASGCQAS